MKTSATRFKTTPEGLVHRASTAALMVAFAALATGCAAPPKPHGPSAFDQELAQSVTRIAKVTSGLRENQGNPALNHYNGFPLPKTVKLTAPEHDSKIAPPPAARPPQPEVAKPFKMPAALNQSVNLQVKDMPVDDLMGLLAHKINWTYAHNGDTAPLKVSLSAKGEPVSQVFNDISRQLGAKANLKVDTQSHMILLKAGA